jgi:hypothetical protein
MRTIIVLFNIYCTDMVRKRCLVVEWWASCFLCSARACLPHLGMAGDGMRHLPKFERLVYRADGAVFWL